MSDIKIAKDVYLPKSSVKFYAAYASNTVINDVREKKKQGRVYDFTSGKKTLTVIYLNSGELILVATRPETIYDRMTHSDKEV